MFQLSIYVSLQGISFQSVVTACSQSSNLLFNFVCSVFLSHQCQSLLCRLDKVMLQKYFQFKIINYFESISIYHCQSFHIMLCRRIVKSYINQIGCKNMRKISTKLITLDDKNKKTEPKTSDNEYYLPHPQIRLVKTPVKDTSLQQQKDKNIIKLTRKTSQYAPIRTFSIANLKSDLQNVSKEQDTTPQNKNNLAKKVELRKFRSTSERETPKRSISKSGLKLQLNSAKKDGPSKRINLKIQTPATKKNEKGSLGSANFDSYYNNQGGNVQSKTVKVQRKLEANSSDSAAHFQFTQLFGRCKRIIEEYQQKLQHVKSENKMLKQQNHKLKSLRDVVKSDVVQW